MAVTAETINMRTDRDRKRRLQLAAEFFDEFIDALAPEPISALTVAATRHGHRVRRAG